MRTWLRTTCRRWLPPSVLRARRVALSMPRVVVRKSWQLRRLAARRAAAAPDAVLAYPFRPHIEDDYTLTHIAYTLGLRLTSDPAASYAAAIYWHDTTRRPASPALERISGSMHVMNLFGNDISKTRVDAAMREVFGYGLGVDPRVTQGPFVDKSDSNALHDGRIVPGPLPNPDTGRVYQRLIRGRHVDGLVEEIRVPVIGDGVPFVHLKYKPPDDALSLSVRGTIADASTVLTDDEIGLLVRLSHSLGIDFGELDVMRDSADGRIYVFDANNTPCVRFVGVTGADRRATIDRLAESFEAAFLLTH